jgi:hypothetical protein
MTTVDARLVATRTVIFALAGLGLVALSRDSVIGWLVPLAVIGGGVTAAALFFSHSRWRQASFSDDRFAREGVAGDVLNMSRVRVAGLGGAGLLLVAILAAFQFPLTAATLLIGAIGGALGGLATIMWRRGA